MKVTNAVHRREGEVREIGILALVGALFLFVLCGLVPSVADATSNMASVSCTSSTACEAVGASDASGASQANARIWNGTAWSGQTTPAPTDAVTSKLSGVHCVSASACVAVGDYSTTTETNQSLAMSWNGTSWSVVSTPSPAGATATTLSGVFCTSSTACVGVGSYVDSAGATKTLTMSWNGSSWSLVTSPNPAEANNQLTEVACWSSTGCIAAGSSTGATGTHSLTLKWDGTSWSVLSTPDPAGATYSSVSSISCVGSTACKGVGSYADASGVMKTLALSWNGISWSVVASPNPSGAASSQLSDVSCTSSSACRAVGSYSEGNKDKPLVESWNGTSWTQQTVESDGLGAVSVKLTGVSCVSSSWCHATGAITYGHSTTERNLAYQYNGTSWVLTESGGYQRVWTLSTIKSLGMAEQVDISCVSSTYCMRVGGLVNEPGIGKAQSMLWSGFSWAGKPVPLPSGARTSVLWGVYCVSTTLCLGVGSYVDSAGVTKTLAMSWNGSTWSVVSSPNASGSTANELTDISCWSSTGCRAVGNFTDASGTHNLALSWNGSVWSLTSIPNPSESTYSSLASLNCLSSSSCIAVGRWTGSSGGSKTLAMSWNGTSWSVVTSPNPAAAVSSQLADLSCTSSTACQAVGSYTESLEQSRTLDLSWNGTAWSVVSTPNQGEGIASVLSGVTCVTASSCLAVGSYVEPTDDTVTKTQAMTWNGTAWTSLSTPNPSGNDVSRLSKVACTTESLCLAIGLMAVDSAAPTKNFGYRLTTSFTGTWTQVSHTILSSQLKGVSCISDSSCVAVGKFSFGLDKMELGWTLDERGWVATAMPRPSEAQLYGVSCSAAGNCMAAGSQASGTLVEHWNGTSWSVQTTPNPSGSGMVFNGVSCPSTTSCEAAGYYVSGGNDVPLIEAWNGTSWTIQTVPAPTGAVSTYFSEISCSASTACTAVGNYKDSGGVWRVFAERWNGTAWTVQTVPQPAGATTTTGYGVSCAGATACILVGNYTTSSGTKLTMIEAWNGPSWSIQSSPNVTGANSNYLLDVSCYTTTRCVAVGSSQPTTSNLTRNPLPSDGTAPRGRSRRRRERKGCRSTSSSRSPARRRRIASPSASRRTTKKPPRATTRSWRRRRSTTRPPAVRRRWWKAAPCRA